MNVSAFPKEAVKLLNALKTGSTDVEKEEIIESEWKDIEQRMRMQLKTILDG